MPKTQQKATGHYDSTGKWIPGVEGKDYDADSAIATEEAGEKAHKAMVAGAKPKVSDDEPEDKASIQYLAWKKRHPKGRATAEDAANALASR